MCMYVCMLHSMYVCSVCVYVRLHVFHVYVYVRYLAFNLYLILHVHMRVLTQFCLKPAYAHDIHAYVHTSSVTDLRSFMLHTDMHACMLHGCTLLCVRYVCMHACAADFPHPCCLQFIAYASVRNKFPCLGS
jgi:hypothetical protein